MAEVDVEPVFWKKRQQLVRDLLTAVVGCAVLWILFLGEPPGAPTRGTARRRRGPHARVRPPLAR